MKICYEPIGILHTELTELSEAPRFYTESPYTGVIEVFPPYEQGLAGLDGQDRIVVLFHFHLSKDYELLQHRRGAGELTGVFNLCSPMRPNPIGMSVLKLTAVKGCNVYVAGLDMVDETPILDIKPFKPFA